MSKSNPILTIKKTSPPQSKNKILFGLSGSIACYKACQLISDLVQSGYVLQTIASKNALKFIGNATLEGLTGFPVLSDIYQEGHQMAHISLVRDADIFVVCPATTSFINKVAGGIADDILTTCFIANNFKIPCVVAPAMNVEMFYYPATQNALEALTSLGIEFVLGEKGALACGEDGMGRMAEVEDIKKAILKALK